jgi:hypothetical protein
MTIHLDPYGILIDAEASTGHVLVKHPTCSTEYGIALAKHPDYTGPVPMVRNAHCVTCNPTLLSRLKFIYNFTKWVFTHNYNSSERPT